MKQQFKIYYEKTKERLTQQRKKYRENNKEKVALQNKKRYKNNLQFRLSLICRNRVRILLGSGQGWSNYLGCTIEFLKKWFEYNFQLDIHKNMNWENYGKEWKLTM